MPCRFHGMSRRQTYPYSPTHPARMIAVTVTVDSCLPAVRLAGATEAGLFPALSREAGRTLRAVYRGLREPGAYSLFRFPYWKVQPFPHLDADAAPRRRMARLPVMKVMAAVAVAVRNFRPAFFRLAVWEALFPPRLFSRQSPRAIS